MSDKYVMPLVSSDSVGRPEPTYSESQVNKIVEELCESHAIKMNSLQYDLDEMRRLYQREQDFRKETRAESAIIHQQIEDLTNFNLQLMKLYYNKATGKDI